MSTDEIVCVSVREMGREREIIHKVICLTGGQSTLILEAWHSIWGLLETSSFIHSF